MIISRELIETDKVIGKGNRKRYPTKSITRESISF